MRLPPPPNATGVSVWLFTSRSHIRGYCIRTLVLGLTRKSQQANWRKPRIQAMLPSRNGRYLLRTPSTGTMAGPSMLHNLTLLRNLELMILNHMRLLTRSPSESWYKAILWAMLPRLWFHPTLAAAAALVGLPTVSKHHMAAAMAMVTTSSTVL